MTALQVCYHYRYGDTSTLCQWSATQLAAVICIPREWGHQYTTLSVSLFFRNSTVFQPELNASLLRAVLIKYGVDATRLTSFYSCTWRSHVCFPQRGQNDTGNWITDLETTCEEIEILSTFKVLTCHNWESLWTPRSNFPRVSTAQNHSSTGTRVVSDTFPILNAVSAIFAPFCVGPKLSMSDSRHACPAHRVSCASSPILPIIRLRHPKKHDGIKRIFYFIVITDVTKFYILQVD